VIGAAAIAAPLPLLWFERQSALKRIAMHIAQLLDPLARAPQIEIVEAALPDVWSFRAKLGLALGSAGPARGCEDQRQNLIAFGFGNAHPPAKSTREGWGNRPCSCQEGTSGAKADGFY
jgi:hypothetical protein